MKKKLSELADNTVITYEGARANETYTVKVIKDEIIKWGIPHHETDGWGIVLEQKKWAPNAQLMFDAYIKNEQLEMYKGWDERVWKWLDDTVVAEIQKILDQTFSYEERITNYWTFSEGVEIDIIPPSYEITFKRLVKKYGHDRAVLIYHDKSIDEVLAYSDEEAAAAVDAINSF
ncbi:hypothetical protein D7X33_18340 [Butyricicoccus sp. 1XD8-22]|nr:hypothetical protein D7X33_18340 [Butyricicoccus sp. 1XD8-22]